jgi:hypothetical protein
MPYFWGMDGRWWLFASVSQHILKKRHAFHK